MEVNSKQTRSHHLSCLSGSSQQSLIGDNGSERSTPISVHSMSYMPPTNKAHRQLNTPLLVGFQESFFFPAGSTNHHHHHNQQQQQSGCSQTQMPLDTNITFSASKNGRSPKSADINLNAESERNREAPSNQVGVNNINISPNQARLSKSRKPTTPNIPPTAFPAFFPDPLSLSNHLHQQPSRRSMNLTTNKSNIDCNNIVSWPQQDDNYHLYHEPLDPEDQNPTPSTADSILSSQIISPDIMKISTPKLNNHPQTIPPDTRTSNMVTTANAATPTIANNTLSNKDWTFMVPNTSNLNKSPTVIAGGDNFSNSSSVKTSTSFANRMEPGSHRNDVSADIYSCYVTRKSDERAKHRSRSYHGPKNTTLQGQVQQLSCIGDVSKNLSSTSIVDLPMSPSAFASSIEPMHLRDHCVRELIETESNYLHALEMILTCFAKPLEPLLRREDNQLIFGHIKYFHHIHSSFKADLVKAAIRSYNRDIASIRSPTHRTNSLAVGAQGSKQQTISNPSTPTAISNIPQQFLAASPLLSPNAQDLRLSPPLIRSHGISSCFLEFKSKFLKYGEYCATLSKAQAHLDELTHKNEAISAQLDRCQQDANEGKFKLRDLLSLPMQRILKYHLLLAQLIKNTSATNDDYHNLKRAHETMVDLGQYINEVKRDTEAIQIINDIEQSITGLDMPPNTQLTDYGRLLIDDIIRVKMPESKTKPLHDTRLKIPHDMKIRYVFVFDKVMLMCKSRGTRQFKEALLLEEYEIVTNLVSASSDTISKSTKEKWSYTFNLVHTCEKTTYSFYAKTLESKNKWVEVIQKAMDNIRPPACRNSETDHDFLMHTFDEASYCKHCGKLLLGLYYQGYRCRNCFTSAHKKCLSSLKHCRSPPRSNNNTSSHSRVRCNEPPSPSVRSNGSDDSHNAIMHFPSSGSQNADLGKNEYTNIESRTEASINPSSSFRENVSTPTLTAHRPVSSMINVSLQNSTNHLLQQRRLLKSSNSTPAIAQRTSLRARAISDYNGQEETALHMRVGDVILVYTNSIEQNPISQEDLEIAAAQLNLGQNGNTIDSFNQNISMWFGKNTRTCREGQFPSNFVEIRNEGSRTQVETDNAAQESCLRINNLSTHVQPGNNHVNFILKDYPWFCGRMDRDEAQAVLEKAPHGTFLVRVSTKREGSYVISLNHSSQVKHMRISMSRDNQLYLSSNRYFKSVTELVSWYEKNSLKESFHMLDSRLSIPFKPTRAQ